MTENEAKEIIKIFPMWNLDDQWLDQDEMQELTAMVIVSLTEIQQYRSIGTVEECREAMKKHGTKKPILSEPKANEILEYHCPECDEFVCHALNIVRTKANKTNYCTVCGCRLDWGV